jgi:oxygen-independent coproporphyrinogen-3 oxidase
MQYLTANGFQQYEVSNYAKPGQECKHNVNYWTHGNYIGFGPSAHSFWSNRRWWNIANLRTYCERISNDQLPVAGDEFLTGEQLLDETVMLGLRSRGVNLQRMKDELGFDLLGTQLPLIEELLSKKMAILNNNMLRLTAKGILLCDEISQTLLARACAA